MSVLCRTLLSVSANPEQRPAQDTLPCATCKKLPGYAKARWAGILIAGGVKNRTFFRRPQGWVHAGDASRIPAQRARHNAN